VGVGRSFSFFSLFLSFSFFIFLLFLFRRPHRLTIRQFQPFGDWDPIDFKGFRVGRLLEDMGSEGIIS